jgi:hypothetical protein
MLLDAILDQLNPVNGLAFFIVQININIISTYASFSRVASSLQIVSQNFIHISPVGIVTGFGLDGRSTGVRFPADARYFLYSTAFRPALGPTQSPYTKGTRGFFPGDKAAGRGADYSPSVSAEVKNDVLRLMSTPS